MTDLTDTLTVSRNDDAQRYEIHVGAVLGGYTEFEPTEGGRLIFPHTVIDHAFRGRGLSTVLVAEAMADAGRRGETIEPLCPVVQRWLREHDAPQGLTVVWPHSADGTVRR